MKRYIALAILMAAPALAAAQSPVTAANLTFSEPAKLAEIDTDRVNGQPSRLAWSPDGTQLYVQMMDGQFGKQGARLSHLLFAAVGGTQQEVQAEPEWVSAYWTAKSGQASPDSPTFKIDLKSEVKQEKTVSAPMGGALAKGGGVGPDGGTSSTTEVISAAYNRQAVPVNTMLLHGEIVGQFVNSVIVPGLTFGWGPRGSQAIAYAATSTGRIVVMDAAGGKKEMPDTKDAVLPAWSPDGSKIAWLQKDGRKKYVLHIAVLGR